MNNAPPAARMPAAGTQALLSIRPGGQRLAAREVLAGRDRLERLTPGHGERLDCDEATMQPADAAERVGGPDRALRGQSAWKMIRGTGDARQ